MHVVAHFGVLHAGPRPQITQTRAGPVFAADRAETLPKEAPSALPPTHVCKQILQFLVLEAILEVHVHHALLGTCLQLWDSHSGHDGLEEGPRLDLGPHDRLVDCVLIGVHALLDGGHAAKLLVVWLSLCQRVGSVGAGLQMDEASLPKAGGRGCGLMYDRVLMRVVLVEDGLGSVDTLGWPEGIILLVPLCRVAVALIVGVVETDALCGRMRPLRQIGLRKFG